MHQGPDMFVGGGGCALTVAVNNLLDFFSRTVHAFHRLNLERSNIEWLNLERLNLEGLFLYHQSIDSNDNYIYL